MKTILLVEDEKDIREDLAQLLERHGFAVVTAENGADALAYLRASPAPTVLILDLMMPVMDGWQLRRELLQDPRLADIPVVALSGTQEIEREATSLSVAGYVAKPFTIRALLSVLNTVC